MNGIILIDKPAGISSFGALAKVRKLISINTGKKAKVGHAGTLDPFATGLLILMVGQATKQANTFLKLDKSYQAVLKLGQESTTADPEGELTDISSSKPREAEISAAISKFTGEIEQLPPIFSAIKVNGQRAYNLARKGLPVELKPRSTTIYGYENVIYNYPYLSFGVSVSSGTYIRSLAVDMGRALGTGAYLTELRRTSIGEYKLEDAHKIDELTPDNIGDFIKPL